MTKIEGKVEVRCTACGVAAEHQLVQLVHAQDTPAAHAQLLRGELNVSVCTCGKRSQLACELVYQDPQRGFLCHVCPGGEVAMRRAEELFDAAFSTSLQVMSAGPAGDGGAGDPGGVSGAASAATYPVQRIVPSVNALLEKVKILDAGLADWAVEMVKVLLLASISVDDDDRVMLFTGVEAPAEGGASTARWLLFDRYGEVPTTLASPLAAVDRLVSTLGGAPAGTQRRIDRAWAIEAVRAMIASAN